MLCNSNTSHGLWCSNEWTFLISFLRVALYVEEKLQFQNDAFSIILPFLAGRLFSVEKIFEAVLRDKL